jgi:hypothetical protein
MGKSDLSIATERTGEKEKLADAILLRFLLTIRGNDKKEECACRMFLLGILILFFYFSRLCIINNFIKNNAYLNNILFTPYYERNKK